MFSAILQSPYAIYVLSAYGIVGSGLVVFAAIAWARFNTIRRQFQAMELND